MEELVHKSRGRGIGFLRNTLMLLVPTMSGWWNQFSAGVGSLTMWGACLGVFKWGCSSLLAYHLCLFALVEYA